VQALFERVDAEQGRLDVLVNNAPGHRKDAITAAPFWDQPLSHWEGMFDRGVRNHVVAARAAAPLFCGNGTGSSSPPRSGTEIATPAPSSTTWRRRP
jgi:NAD(P)-dependent dehydrogenase (short-subunit alcohol dehydrogenase family)